MLNNKGVKTILIFEDIVYFSVPFPQADSADAPFGYSEFFKKVIGIKGLMCPMKTTDSNMDHSSGKPITIVSRTGNTIGNSGQILLIKYHSVFHYIEVLFCFPRCSAQ